MAVTHQRSKNKRSSHQYQAINPRSTLRVVGISKGEQSQCAVMKIEVSLHEATLNLVSDEHHQLFDEALETEGFERYYGLVVSGSKAFAPSRLMHLFETAQTETKTLLGSMVLTPSIGAGRGSKHLLFAMDAAGLSNDHEPLRHTIGCGDRVITLQEIITHHIKHDGEEFLASIRLVDFPAVYEEYRWKCSSVPPGTNGPQDWDWEVRGEIVLGFKVTEIEDSERAWLGSSPLGDSLLKDEERYRELLSLHVNETIARHQSIPLSLGTPAYIHDCYAPSYPSAFQGIELPGAIALTTTYDTMTDESLYEKRLREFLQLMHIKEPDFVSTVHLMTEHMATVTRIQEGVADTIEPMQDIDHDSTSVKVFALVHALLTSPMVCMPYTSDISYVHNGSDFKTIVEQIEPKRTHKFDCEDGAAEVYRCFTDLTRRATSFRSELLKVVGAFLRHFVCVIGRFDAIPEGDGDQTELHIAPILIPRMFLRVWLCRGFLEEFAHEEHTLSNEEYQTIGNAFAATKTVLEPPEWWFEPNNHNLLSSAVYGLVARPNIERENAFQYCQRMCGESATTRLANAIRDYGAVFPMMVLCDTTTYGPTAILTNADHRRITEPRDELTCALMRSIRTQECGNHIAVVSHPASVPLFDRFYLRLVSLAIGNPLVELAKHLQTPISDTHENMLHHIALDYALLDDKTLSASLPTFNDRKAIFASLEHFSLRPLVLFDAPTLDAALAVLSSEEPIECLYPGPAIHGVLTHKMSHGHAPDSRPFPYLHIRSMFYDPSEVARIITEAQAILNADTKLSTRVNELCVGATNDHSSPVYLNTRDFFQISAAVGGVPKDYIGLLKVVTSQRFEEHVYAHFAENENTHMARKFMASLLAWVLSLPMTYVVVSIHAD